MMAATIHHGPRFRDFHVEMARGLGYVVCDKKGAWQTDPVAFRPMAERARDELQRAADKLAKRGPRPCMHCGSEFDSDGIHNRLCSRCRTKAPDNEPQRPYIGKRA